MDILLVLLVLGAAAAALEIAEGRLRAALEHEEASLAAEKAAEEAEAEEAKRDSARSCRLGFRARLV